MDKILTFNFTENGKKIENAPLCGMSLKAAGSMRFRWAEDNPARDAFFEQICGSREKAKQSLVPVELIHSQTVYFVETPEDTLNLCGDGIITRNSNLMPTVTVADCVPIYLYEKKTGVFGIVHSGWKGTGIAKKAIDLAFQKFGSKPEDFYVIIGPHIRECCYIVNEERASYFRQNFGNDCITVLEPGGKCFAGGKGLAVEWDNGNNQLYRLSLEKANLELLIKSGVNADNINVIKECTCCNELFGSNRRETAMLSKKLERKLTPEEAGKMFTVQAAFINLKPEFVRL